MSAAGAEKSVLTAALVVALIYGYRVSTEGQGSSGFSVARAAGQGEPLPVSSFLTAWGFTFLVVSIVAEASPQVGGWFAILIIVGDLLSNGQAIFEDVSEHSNMPVSGSATATTAETGIADTSGTAATASPASSPQSRSPGTASRIRES